MTASWQQELRDFLLTALYVALAGPIVGLVWWQVAPKMTRQSMIAVATGTGAPYHPVFGADLWFLLFSALAGIACTLLVLLFRTASPGVVVGLAVGSAAAGVIADRVGFVAQRGQTLANMRAVGIVPGGLAHDLLDFKVRAVGVVAAWPIAALVVYLAALAIADRHRSLP